ncbi:hypothetical protein CQW23_04165 [Capsicum baccatum]|uniref:Ubiquitin-like protease family profile domain-containing protein n=1 Tax=Capsicum baccatum TaxID=33114 RepID=A0A2G2XDZ3_CAPBA|nr:hypothetical protein CQW23_04165 [Capsicum baccatum]
MASISRSMNEVQKFYPLSGLPYALQIWWYECCAKVDESLAIRVHNLIPRMVSWKVVKPKPRYEDLMDDILVRNITLSPQELNHLDLPNPLMFGSTDAAANVSQAVAVQQQSERTSLTEFEDEFDDFSISPSADLLKKMRLDAGQSSHPPAKKLKIVEELEKMRDADKAPATAEEKLSLSKSDLDEIKSYVKTYVDMKFNDLQKLMVDHYTGLLGVVKEGFASYEKITQYPVHESEKDNPDIEEDPHQSLNEHKTDAKSDNIVDDVGQSSKVGGNEEEAEESLKKKDRTDWSLLDVYKEKMDQHVFDVHIVDGIVQQSSGTLDCGLFVSTYAEFLSDRHQISSLKFDPKKHRTRYASLLQDYGVNKTCTGYVSENQDPPRPKHTFIRSEDTEMIDVEP